MKIVLLEVSHWHFPLYQEALRRPDVEIVGVSDRDASVRDRVAAYYGCPAFADWREALARDDIDFAFAFGRHAEMPRIGEALVERDIPFAIEKPCGLKAEDVARLRRMAEERKLYVAVPFIMRLSPLLRLIEELALPLPSDFPHLAFRFIAGPPARYLGNGSPWMLDPAISGGGCTINLAGHFIDLIGQLTGAAPEAVHGRMSNGVYGAPVEDCSVLTLTRAGGGVAIVETGYSFPMTGAEQREFSLTISSPAHYLRTVEGGVRVYDRATGECADRAVELETDGLYAIFVDRVLAGVRAGKPPIAGLADAEAVLRVVDAGYASNESGRLVDLLTGPAATQAAQSHGRPGSER